MFNEMRERERERERRVKKEKHFKLWTMGTRVELCLTFFHLKSYNCKEWFMCPCYTNVTRGNCCSGCTCCCCSCSCCCWVDRLVFWLIDFELIKGPLESRSRLLFESKRVPLVWMYDLMVIGFTRSWSGMFTWVKFNSRDADAPRPANDEAINLAPVIVLRTKSGLAMSAFLTNRARANLEAMSFFAVCIRAAIASGIRERVLKGRRMKRPIWRPMLKGVWAWPRSPKMTRRTQVTVKSGNNFILK